jgi:hypothetical protein
MAGEIGNDFSNKNNRLWRETLRRVAAQNPAKLREIAEALYEKAAQGDVAAIKEIGDRLDGKALQSVDLTAEVAVTGFTWQK